MFDGLKKRLCDIKMNNISRTSHKSLYIPSLDLKRLRNSLDKQSENSKNSKAVKPSSKAYSFSKIPRFTGNYSSKKNLTLIRRNTKKDLPPKNIFH